jgi:hypothetical protein
MGPWWCDCEGPHDEPAGRLGFVAACLRVFAAAALRVHWSAPPPGLSGKTPATVTLAPGASRPAGLTVTDLHDVAELQARFNVVLRPEGARMRRTGFT